MKNLLLILTAVFCLSPIYGATVSSPSGIASGSTVATLTVTNLTATTATVTGIVGTTTNNNANTGNYGEFVSSINVVGGVAGSNGQYSNVAQITLTAGDWDVSGCGWSTPGTATPTRMQFAISLNSGNTTTDHQLGYNNLDGLPPTSVVNMTQCISNFRVSASGSTTVYAKVAITYPANTPQVFGTVTARRVR
jgi:hypothetical protein